MDDCPDMVESLLEKGICNVDEGADSVGPPIYQCIKLENQECLNVLCKFKPDMNYIDKNNQSLLHLIMRNNLLLMTYDHILNCFTNYSHQDQLGLTPLHLAVIEANEEMISLIIKNDTRWNRELNINLKKIESEFIGISQSTNDYNTYLLLTNKLSSKENVLSLNLKIHHNIFECILPKIKERSTLKTDGDGNNILHLTSIYLLPNLCQRVLNISNRCLVKRNNKGNTPLMELIELIIPMGEKITDELTGIVRCLAADRDKTHLTMKFKDGCSILQKALTAVNEKLLLIISHFYPGEIKFTKEDILFCINNKFYSFLNDNFDRFPKTVTGEAFITQEVFISLITEPPYKCVEQLKVHLSNLNEDLITDNMLYSIYNDSRNMDLFHTVTKFDANAPHLLQNGETILTYFIFMKNVKMCEDIIKKYKDKLVNKKNSSGYLPIHLAVEYKQYQLVSLLVPHVVDINEENSRGESVLYFLIKQLDNADDENERNGIFRIIENIIQVGGNIYLKSQKLERAPIEECNNLVWNNKLRQTTIGINSLEHQQDDKVSALVNN